jgi:hypothetical protein
MRREFGARDGGYRRDGPLGRLGARAHLWPFARAFVAALDVAGIEPEAMGGFDPDAEIAAHLAALERYWDPRGPLAAYASDRPGSLFGADRYYDDNAWVGLALVQLQRLRPGSGELGRAAALARFAAGGWDARAGGVFWVEQGRGAGRRCHDRNTVSTAPNAALALHLAELGARDRAADPTPEEMYEWVQRTLAAADAPALYRDKVRGDGTIDPALWSYNQGSMIGLGVLLARRGGERASDYLREAERTAERALQRYAGQRLHRQPAEFNAILFRNLLLLPAASADRALREQIITAMRAYADELWSTARDERDRFHLGPADPTLLGQSAVVQLLALLAWAPERYELLA